MLKHKQYWDLTGNGVNHPNDFGHRIYAQVLTSLPRPIAPKGKLKMKSRIDSAASESLR